MVHNLKLRDEHPSDFARVDAIHAVAFGGTSEVQVVRAIRASSAYRPNQSFVACMDGVGIVGHLLLSPVGLQGPDDIVRVITVIAPLAVDPQFHGRGIGSRLMLHAVAQCGLRQCPLLVLRGGLEYYGRFGFVRSSDIGVYPPFMVATDRYLARPLAAYHVAFRGTVRYPSTFAAVGYSTQWTYDALAD